VTIRVLQGERKMADGNVELGRFDLVGIPPAPRGIPQVEVTFDIDQNGIVHVNAKDLGTGKEQSIKITASTKLSKEEIDKYIKEAEKFAGEDEKKKDEVDTINQADTLVYATEKALKDYGDKVSQQERGDIEAKINDLKQAMKDKSLDRVKKGMEELSKVSHKLAEEIYKKTQQDKGQGAGAGGAGAGQEGPGYGPQGPQQGEETQEESAGPKKDEDIIDAEYTAEDDDKKKKK